MYATSSDRISIHYHVEGDGTPLVLLHGFADRGNSWRDAGYLAPLVAGGSRVILIDQRGHGASDAPHRREDYSGALRAADVIAVLDALGLQQADIFGYSMGGWCALNVAASHPDRVGRLVVGGSHPFAQSLSFYRNALRSKAVWSGIMLALGGSLTPDWQARIRQNDVEALRAAVAEDRPDISGSLKTFPRDCLFYVGSKDSRRESVARAAASMPHAEFAELPGCDHIQTFLRADRVVPLVTAFLKTQRQC